MILCRIDKHSRRTAMYTAKRKRRTQIITTKMRLADHWRTRAAGRVGRQTAENLSARLSRGEMQITRDATDATRAHVRNIARDALIRGTISSTVATAVLTRGLYPGVEHNVPPRCS